MRNNILVILCTLCTVSFLLAAPMSGNEFSLKQPDGSRVPVKVYGDEFYQSIESPDGYTLIRDSEGWICYAELTSSGELRSTSTRYDGTTANVRSAKHLRETGEIQLEKRNTMRKELGLKSIEEEKAEFAKRKPLPPVRNVDTIYGLTVLIDFPDKKSDVDREEITKMINQVGYSNYNNNGSLRDFYWDASAGKLVYLNVITEFYTAKNNKGYYDTPGGWGKAQDLITESMNWLKNNGFDFSQITGKNGKFQCLNFYYAGVPDHGWSKGLWPHKGYYSGSFSAAGLRAADYQFTNIGSELDNYTFIHENGHMLCGYPDLYSYESGHNGGLNGMCAMASNMPKNPVMFNPYFRDLLGWMDVTQLSQASEGKLFKDVSNDEKCYRWGNGPEYFYIENREKDDRSAKLAGEGLMIWHVNENGSNTKKSSYGLLVALEQADGKKTMEEGGRGNPEDWFYEGNKDRFNDNTTPNAKYQTGSASGLDVANISAIAIEMSFSIGEIDDNLEQITIKTPAGGESYSTGQEISITWEDNFDADVVIDLKQGGSTAASISSGTASSGSFDWTVPGSVSPGEYTIKISSKDDATVTDESGSFTIIEAIDTTNPSSFNNVAGWDVSGDSDGSTFSIDTTKKESESLIGGSIKLIKSDDSKKIYPWAKVSAWVSPGNLDSVTAIRITYTSTSDLQVFFEDSTLSADGIGFEHTLAKATSKKSVLLTAANFKQPSWIADSQKTDLILKRVNGISFGSTTSEAEVHFELHEVVVYNFTGIPDAVLGTGATSKNKNIIISKDRLTLSVDAPVQLFITSVNGRIIMNEHLSQAGTHSFNFKENNLASGVYFYKIKEATNAIRTGNFVVR